MSPILRHRRSLLPYLRRLVHDADVTYMAPPAYSLKLTVDVEHHFRVNARWFDIWAGAVAVSAMCTVSGLDGVSGLTSGLTVTIAILRDPRIGNETASF